MANDIDLVIGAQDKASAVINAVAGKVSSFIPSLAALGPAAIGVGTALAGAAASMATFGAAFNAVSDAANRIDELTHTARGLGETVGDLQAFQFAMDEAGQVSAEGTIAALQKVQRIVGEVAEGGKGGDIFAKLGLDASRLSLEKPISQFMAIKTAIGSIENANERAVVATQLLGKSAADLIPAIIASNDEFSDSIAAAQQLGVVVSEEAAQAIGAMNGEIGRTQAGLEGLASQVAAELAPVVKEVVQFLNGFLPPIVAVAKTGLPPVIDSMVMFAGITKDVVAGLTSLQYLDLGGALDALNADTGTKWLEGVRQSRQEASEAAQQSARDAQVASDAQIQLANEEAQQQDKRQRETLYANQELQKQIALIEQVKFAIAMQTASGGSESGIEQLKQHLSTLEQAAQQTFGKIASLGEAQEGAANKTIEALNRRLAVLAIGEEAVKKQEELATAATDAEREKIAILQHQIEQQEKLNELAKQQTEEKKKQEEIAAKNAEQLAKESQKQAELQAKQFEEQLKQQQQERDAIRSIPTTVTATESRLLTRGSTEQGVDKLVDINKTTNRILERIAKQGEVVPLPTNTISLELIN